MVRMFRFLYLVVLIGGLLWIVQTRPLWLDPSRAARLQPAGSTAQAWELNEEARMDEMFRRLWWVAGATVVVVAGGETWNLLRTTIRRG